MIKYHHEIDYEIANIIVRKYLDNYVKSFQQRPYHESLTLATWLKLRYQGRQHYLIVWFLGIRGKAVNFDKTEKGLKIPRLSNLYSIAYLQACPNLVKQNINYSNNSRGSDCSEESIIQVQMHNEG